MNRTLFFPFLFLLIVPSVAVGQTPVPEGNEFQVNHYTSGYQGFPRVAAGAAGDFVVVWGGESLTSTSPDCPFYGDFDCDVFARIYDSDGQPQDVEFRVNSFTDGLQYFPNVAKDPAGNFIVTWTDYGIGSPFPNGWARFDSDGLLLEELRPEDEGGTGSSVATDAQGNYVVTWAGGLVVAQLVSSSGVKVGGELQVNEATSSDGTDVAMTPSGDFVVVWVDQFYGVDGSGDGIFRRRFDSNGNPLDSGELQVNTFTTGDQDFPGVALLSDDGDFVVVWGSDGQDGSGTGIFRRRFDSNGHPLDPVELQVNSYTDGNQLLPSVAASADGTFVVVWQSYGSSGSDADSYSIQGQLFTRNGTPVGDEFQVNSHTPDGQIHPSVAMASSGDFVVVWESEKQDGSGEGVFGQRFEIPLVKIDIKPGSDPNCFNSNGNGVIPVAILSSEDFDATGLDPSTIALDGQEVRVVGKKGNVQSHIEDANTDGRDDLVVQIVDEDGTFAPGESTATLTGATYGGTRIFGTDSICVVP